MPHTARAWHLLLELKEAAVGKYSACLNEERRLPRGRLAMHGMQGVVLIAKKRCGGGRFREGSRESMTGIPL